MAEEDHFDGDEFREATALAYVELVEKYNIPKGLPATMLAVAHFKRDIDLETLANDYKGAKQYFHLFTEDKYHADDVSAAYLTIEDLKGSYPVIRWPPLRGKEASE